MSAVVDHIPWNSKYRANIISHIIILHINIHITTCVRVRSNLNGIIMFCALRIVTTD